MYVILFAMYNNSSYGKKMIRSSIGDSMIYHLNPCHIVLMPLDILVPPNFISDLVYNL